MHLIIECGKFLSNLQYDIDYSNIQTSIQNTLNNEKPLIKTKSYWFGIFETISSSKAITCYQGYIAAYNKYNNNEGDDLFVDPEYFPENRFIESDILSNLPSILNNYKDNYELHYFSLWYLTIVIGLFVKQNKNQLLFNTTKSYIFVGYDDGDYNKIGYIDKDCFKVNSVKTPKPAILKKTLTRSEYYAMNAVFGGAWFIKDIVKANNEQFVCGFASMCKEIHIESNIIGYCDERYDGIPVDFNDVTLAGPLVSRKLMDIFIENITNQDDIQFVPVTIVNANNEVYYLMNVLKSIECLDYKNTVFSSKNYANTIVLNKSKIENNPVFRLSDNIINDYIFINADLKKLLESEKITGVKLIDIEVL